MIKNPNKPKKGRKSKYDTIIKPRETEIAEMLKLGATDKEIAKNLRISPQTFCEYKTRFPEFNEFIKENRKSPIIAIKAALFKRACGYTATEKTINETKDGTFITIKEKHIPADPASAMILLKHWARDEGWTNDPAQLQLKERELELKKQLAEKDNW